MVEIKRGRDSAEAMINDIFVKILYQLAMFFCSLFSSSSIIQSKIILCIIFSRCAIIFTYFEMVIYTFLSENISR